MTHPTIDQIAVRVEGDITEVRLDHPDGILIEGFGLAVSRIAQPDAHARERLHQARRALEACAKLVPVEFRWQQAGQQNVWVTRDEWQAAVDGLNACGLGAAGKAAP